MNAKDIEHYLHEHIPLSQAMQVSVVSASLESVVLAAPLAPNINHRETVFGGSASALAILAAWSLLHARLQGEGLRSRLVIQRNDMAYIEPIPGAFTARSALHDPAEWLHFKRVFMRKGKARIAVASVLEYERRIVGRFHGEFVALGAPLA